MFMNRIETAVINSAARRGLQRYYEAPLLARLGGRSPAAGRWRSAAVPGRGRG